MLARLISGCLVALSCATIIACGGSASSTATTADGGGSGGASLDRATKRALSVDGKAVRPSVDPTRGNPGTAFVLSFTARQRTGVIGQARRGYEAYARAPGRIGCQFDTASGGRPTRAGQRVRIALDPGTMEGPKKWCSGHFHGTVKLQFGYACPAHGNCHIPPGFPRPRPQTVGHFNFTVPGRRQ